MTSIPLKTKMPSYSLTHTPGQRRRSRLPQVVATLFTLVLATSWIPSAAATSLQPDSLLSYVPSLPANAIIAAFYGLWTVILFVHTARTRSPWALCLPIGTAFSCLGYGLRLLQRQNSQQGKQSIYIPMYLFVVLSPACYLAFNYIVFGRFVVAVTSMGGAPSDGAASGRPASPDEHKETAAAGGGVREDQERRLASPDRDEFRDVEDEAPSRGRGCFGERQSNKIAKKSKKAPLTEKSPFSLLPPRLYTAVFVISDVITFLVQAVGGAFQAAGTSVSVTNLGNHIFLAGVTLQFVSYVFFVVLVGWTHLRLYRIDPAFFGFKLRGLFQRSPSPAAASAGRTLLVLTSLYFSSVCILVRCIYRIIEMAQGYYGTLFTHEIYTDVLDALPLILGTGIWVLVWPGARDTRANGGSGLVRGIGPSDKVRQVLAERGAFTGQQ